MNCEDMFEFELWSGKYAISEFLRKNDETVKAIEIPSEHNGIPVYYTVNTAFRRSPYIEEVYVPDSMLVSAEMFYRCKRLKKVRIGGEAVYKGAFSDCTALENIEFSHSVRRIDQAAFMNCEALKKVVLPRSLERIDDFAFSGCISLEELTFPEKRVEIGALSFGIKTKLPAETLLYSLIGANDLSEPIKEGIFLDYRLLFDREVFALAVEHDCLRKTDKPGLFKKLIKHKDRELLPISEKLLTSELADDLIRFCTDEGMTEETAWLLDCKNRRFGFNGGDKFDL